MPARELPAWRPPWVPPPKPVAVTIHAVRGDAAATLCAERPARGLVLRAPEQARFFLARPEACKRCAGLTKRLRLAEAPLTR